MKVPVGEFKIDVLRGSCYYQPIAIYINDPGHDTYGSADHISSFRIKML